MTRDVRSKFSMCTMDGKTPNMLSSPKQLSGLSVLQNLEDWGIASWYMHKCVSHFYHHRIIRRANGKLPNAEWCAHASWQLLFFAWLCAGMSWFVQGLCFLNSHNIPHRTVEWFIQANQKTSPLPLLINIDVTRL